MGKRDVESREIEISAGRTPIHFLSAARRHAWPIHFVNSKCCSRQPFIASRTCTSLFDLWEFPVASQTLGFAVLTCSAQGCAYSHKIAQESGAFKDAEAASVDPGTNSGTNQWLEAALAGGPEL